MAFLHKILKTNVYIVDDDADFIRILKQLFARSIENYRIITLPSLENLMQTIKSQSASKIQRHVFILSVSAQASDNTSVFDTIEKLKDMLTNSHVIVMYGVEELDKKELELYKGEILIDDLIIKNNFARLRIQNAIRRILSRDDFKIRRKLMFVSAGVASFFLLLTVMLFFIG
jgi:DNA-binding NtrC family response regulator